MILTVSTEVCVMRLIMAMMSSPVSWGRVRLDDDIGYHRVDAQF